MLSTFRELKLSHGILRRNYTANKLVIWCRPPSDGKIHIASLRATAVAPSFFLFSPHSQPSQESRRNKSLLSPDSSCPSLHLHTTLWRKGGRHRDPFPPAAKTCVRKREEVTEKFGVEGPSYSFCGCKPSPVMFPVCCISKQLNEINV